MFIIGTLISMLIILNMVIAVMTSAFEKVEADEVPYQYRTKLRYILDYLHQYEKDLQGSKYVLSIVVDPEIDPIVEEPMMTQINNKIDLMF